MAEEKVAQLKLPVAELVPLKSIKLNGKNPRFIKDKKFDALVESIRKFPEMLYLRPIIVDDNMIILGGNMRYRAATKLKIKTVPVIKASDLTEEQKAEFIIKDNVSYGQWDYDLLANEWDNGLLKDWQVGTFNVDAVKFYDDKEGENTVDASVAIDSMKPHPKRFKEHPEDQLQHIINSIRSVGVLRNVILAKDGTILDGHALVLAAESIGLETLPATRLNIEPDSVEALKILAGISEIGKLSDIDDRKLTELLKEVKDAGGLEGTGYDEMQLANLLMVSRPAHEIADLNEAAEYVGLTDFEAEKDRPKIVISFETEAEREQFSDANGMKILKKSGLVWSTRYPYRDYEKLADYKYIDEDGK